MKIVYTIIVACCLLGMLIVLPAEARDTTVIESDLLLNVKAPAVPPEKNNGTLSPGSPAEDIDLVVQSYVFVEGAVTIPWIKKDGHASWDLYRSEDGAPYIRMNDFRLDKTEFTDAFAPAGHVYLYKFVSYNASGKAVYVSPPVKVSVVAASNVIVLQLNDKEALINGVRKPLAIAPFLLDGRTMVPLRFVSEALGAEVKWDNDERKITLLLGERTIILYVDSNKATVNGKIENLDVPATIVNGSTVVPIRFVGESFLQDISYDDATKTITIRDAQLGQPEPLSSTKLDDLLGEWIMQAPDTSVFAGRLYIFRDGTFEHYMNGELTREGKWAFDQKSGTLELKGYKRGWDWVVAKTNDGIRVSSNGILETGERLIK